MSHVYLDDGVAYAVVRIPFSDGSGDVALVGICKSRTRAEARAWRDARDNSEPLERYAIFAVPIDVAHIPIPADQVDADIVRLDAQEPE